jgi:putative amide transporter protein
VAAVGLLYVGAVLFVNGLALAGLVKGTSMIPMNLFVGLLQVITPLYLIFNAHGNQASIVGASGLFLFGFTYLYVAMNNAFNLDPTGLGWFCLFVVFSACVYSFWNFTHAGALGIGLAGGNNAVGELLGVLWATWAVLWLFFWFVLGLGRTGLTVFTGAWTAAQGIYTGFIPAIVLLNIPRALTTTFAVVIGVISVGTFIIFWVLLKPKWSVVEASSPEPSVPSTAYSGA